MTATDPALQTFMTRGRERVETALEQALPDAATHPARLHAAMRYAVLGGGKRIRPLLVYAAGEAVGHHGPELDGPACAVELIHAYSLIHDDLPAMDDDDLRRGRPTCHRAYDEATAILAGDALQALAFQRLAANPGELPPAVRLRMLENLALAAGSRGMVGGQSIDLAAVGRELDLVELEDMHIHKTGALIRVSVLLGALCRSDIESGTLERLDHYGKCLGLAFQVWDDVLDVSGDSAALGKTTGVDAAREKPTYPALLGLEPARERALELAAEAAASVAPLGNPALPLRLLAEHVVQRGN